MAEDVTLTITTCRRLPLFIKTIISLARNISYNDYKDIVKIVWCDDNSSDDSRFVIEALIGHVFPVVQCESIFLNESERGLGNSLNRIFQHVDTKYFYHLEDDWQFQIKKYPIFARSRQIMEENPEIKSVISRKLDMYSPRKLADGSEFFLCEKGVDRTGEMRGHGYSLNPSFQDFEFFKKYLPFHLTNVESSFGNQMYDDGYRVATIGADCVQHIGHEISAFQINNTPR